MRGLRFLGAALLCGALAFPVHAAGTQADPCPGATAWAQAHPDESDEALARRDAARTFSDPALRAELAKRAAADQKVRKDWLLARSDRGAIRMFALVDENNLAWLRHLVRTKGFPTAAQVGEQGVGHAWLLLHHAGAARELQAAMLPVLRQRAIDGELGLNDFARFTDRVLKAHDRPQYYGTQFSPGQWATRHFGLPDEASVREVDAHRRELGVMPLADYVCMMSEARK